MQASDSNEDDDDGFLKKKKDESDSDEDVTPLLIPETPQALTTLKPEQILPIA